MAKIVKLSAGVHLHEVVHKARPTLLLHVTHILTATCGIYSLTILPTHDCVLVFLQEGSTSGSPAQVGDGDVEAKTEASLSVHSSPSELNPLFMEENEPPVESMEVEESFPLMEAVGDKMLSSSSDSSQNSEAEVSESCFVTIVGILQFT